MRHDVHGIALGQIVGLAVRHLHRDSAAVGGDLVGIGHVTRKTFAHHSLKTVSGSRCKAHGFDKHLVPYCVLAAERVGKSPEIATHEIKSQSLQPAICGDARGVLGDRLFLGLNLRLHLVTALLLRLRLLLENARLEALVELDDFLKLGNERGALLPRRGLAFIGVEHVADALGAGLGRLVAAAPRGEVVRLGVGYHFAVDDLLALPGQPLDLALAVPDAGCNVHVEQLHGVALQVVPQPLDRARLGLAVRVAGDLGQLFFAKQFGQRNEPRIAYRVRVGHVAPLGGRAAHGGDQGVGCGHALGDVFGERALGLCGLVGTAHGGFDCRAALPDVLLRHVFE